MTELSPAPLSFSHGEVTVVFSHLTEGDEEKGFVPGYHFKIRNQRREEVGHLNVRIGETDHVRFAAGHIGYEIAEEYRGKGYAGEACLAAAPWIGTVLDTVLITTDPDNFPSIRTIERIGATFLDEVDVPPDDPHFTRGSVRKRRYLWKPSKIAPVAGNEPTPSE